MSSLGRGFDAVADQYDDVRPGYPDEMYDAIDRVAGPLSDARVLDLAAGTGIATRALVARGAWVVAVEPGEPMLQRLRRVSPGQPAAMGTAEALPLRDVSLDLVTCATAWHWLDPESAVAEIQRVVRPGGHLALWWANNMWAQGVDWENARTAVYNRWQTNHGSRPPTYRGVRPSDAAKDLRRRGLEVVFNEEFIWTRERTREQHVQAIATHSDVIALGDQKQAFLDDVLTALEPWPVVTERLWGPLVIARI